MSHTRAKKKPIKTKLLGFKVTLELHTQFAATCMARGEKISQVLRQLARTYIIENATQGDLLPEERQVH